jgi:hypothetical protein
MAADLTWQLPSAAPQLRRPIKILAVGLVLLVILGVQQGFLYKERAEEQAVILRARQAEDDRLKQRQARWLKSAPADLMTDVDLCLTFEPDTTEQIPAEIVRDFGGPFGVPRLTIKPELAKADVAKDSSSHNHHAVLFGATFTDAGRVGGGVALSGGDTFIYLPTLQRTWLNSGNPFAISMWLYESRYHARCYLFHSGSPDLGLRGASLSRDPWSRNFDFHLETPRLIVKSTESGALAWHHVAGVWTGSEAEIYLDGQLNRSRTGQRFDLVEEPLAIPVGVMLGIRFEGTIDEVLLFRRRLFPEEVLRLYQMGLEGKRPSSPDKSPSLGPFIAAIEERRVAEKKSLEALLNLTTESGEFYRFDLPAHGSQVTSPLAKP